MSVHDRCVLWGDRVIFPPAGHSVVLKVQHVGHSGVTKMKQLARSIVWWPGIGKDLENNVRVNEQGALTQKLPSHEPLHPWERPSHPWARLNVNYAGPFMGKMFLVLIDAYSKWKDMHTVPSATSHSTISVLRTIFASHGLPEIFVSDN